VTLCARCQSCGATSPLSSVDAGHPEFVFYEWYGKPLFAIVVTCDNLLVSSKLP
jgi:hypothetical protein